METRELGALKEEGSQMKLGNGSTVNAACDACYLEFSIVASGTASLRRLGTYLLPKDAIVFFNVCMQCSGKEKDYGWLSKTIECHWSGRQEE